MSTAPENSSALSTPKDSSAAAPTSSTAAPDLEKALATPCRVLLVTKGKKATAAIPELGILARGSDAAAAHAEALRQRELRLREFAEEGLLHELPTPADSVPGAERLLYRLRFFLIKAAIASALFLGAANIVSGGLRDIGYVLEKKLAAVATWPPETVEMHRDRAERIAKNLVPILLEFTKAMSAPAQSQDHAQNPAQGQADPAQANATQAAPSPEAAAGGKQAGK